MIVYRNLKEEQIRKPFHSGAITLAQYYLFSIIPQDKGIIRLGNPVTLRASEPEPDIAIVRPLVDCGSLPVGFGPSNWAIAHLKVVDPHRTILTTANG